MSTGPGSPRPPREHAAVDERGQAVLLAEKRRVFSRMMPTALAYLCFVGGPLLAHFAVVPPLAGFGIFALSSVLALAGCLAGAIDFTRRKHRGALIQAFVSLVPLLVMGVGLAAARSYPPINDISTDLDNPPRFVVAQKAKANTEQDMVYPDEFKPIVRKAYPDLLSLQKPTPPLVAFEDVRRLASHRPGWHITRIDVASFTIEGNDTSKVFRFKDDFVIRVQELDTGSQIDMRSRSRVGKGDFGANAKRIRAFFADLQFP